MQSETAVSPLAGGGQWPDPALVDDSGAGQWAASAGGVVVRGRVQSGPRDCGLGDKGVSGWMARWGGGSGGSGWW